jgi:cytochrome P450
MLAGTMLGARPRQETHDFDIAEPDGSIRPAVLADPYSLYDRLRRYAPVRYDEALRGWTLTRFVDVQAAMTDDRLSATRTQAYLNELPAVDRARFRQFAAARGDMLLFCEGDKHTRLRRVVRRALHVGCAEIDLHAVATETARRCWTLATISRWSISSGTSPSHCRSPFSCG